MTDMIEVAIVSTSRFVLALHIESNKIKIVHSYFGIYYGIAQNFEGGLCIATRNSYASLRDLSNCAREQGSIILFDDALQTKDILTPPFALRDVHGLLVDDGELFACCSFDNMIARLDLASLTWTRWYPHPHVEHRDADFNHFNTISCHGHELLIVAHNRGPSDIMIFDRKSLDLKKNVRLGFCAHDVWIEDDRLHTLSSDEGLVISEAGIVRRTNAFPRGYAVVDGFHLVGLSARVPADERVKEDGVVRIFDSKWNELADIGLPEVGMINDIALFRMREEDFSSLRSFAPSLVNSIQFNSAVYSMNRNDARLEFYENEWHDPDNGGRWTASCTARVGVFVNPIAPSQFQVALSSAETMQLTIMLNDVVIFDGVIDPTRENDLQIDLAEAFSGSVVITFQTPRLYKPANGDHRSIGVKVYHIRVHDSARRDSAN